MNKSYTGTSYCRMEDDPYAAGEEKPERRTLRFTEACAAVALLIVVLLVQSTFGIDSLLTAVAGALAGAIVVFFGGRALGKGKDVEG